MYRYFALCAFLILNACQVYRSNFECPPGKGVPCTSITDIEKMIVETPDNEADIFLGYLPSENVACEKICKSMSQQKRRVWIEEKLESNGLYTEGHYIYVNKRSMP
jgi:hypothetical protein